jgi:hypothetical protein
LKSRVEERSLDRLDRHFWVSEDVVSKPRSLAPLAPNGRQRDLGRPPKGVLVRVPRTNRGRDQLVTIGLDPELQNLRRHSRSVRMPRQTRRELLTHELMVGKLAVETPELPNLLELPRRQSRISQELDERP